ncbi:unnamed protein product, partial [marine sediment metagenome]
VADVGLQIYENLLEGGKNPQSVINPSSFHVSLQALRYKIRLLIYLTTANLPFFKTSPDLFSTW